MMGNALKRVVSSGIDSYTAPIEREICGVRIIFKPAPDGVDWSHWQNILEHWLPKFESIGWLEDFQLIIIGEDVTPDMHLGSYNDNRTIDLERDIAQDKDQWWSNSNAGDEYVFVHEFIHHAHITLNGYDARTPLHQTESMKKDVSNYASKNVNEAIAEIGSGILLGQEFPDWVHEFYEEHDGPMGVYEL